MPIDSRPARNQRTGLKGALLWLGGFALLGVALQQVNLAKAWTAVVSLSAWQLVALIALNAAVLVLLTARWGFLVRAMGFEVSLSKLFGYRLASFGVSFLTPGPQFGGEPLQVLLLQRRHQVPTGVALGSVAVDKTLDLIANFAFLVAGALLWIGWGVAETPVGSSAAIAAALLLAVPLAYLGGLALGRTPFSGLIGWLVARLGATRLSALRQTVEQAEHSAVAVIRERPGAVGVALALSLASWLFLSAEFWLMLNFLGASASFIEALLVLTLVRLAFLLPFPGGVGVMEAALLLGCRALGFSAELAMSAAMLIRARDLSLAVGGLLAGARALRTPPQSASAPTAKEVELVRDVDELAARDLSVTGIEPGLEPRRRDVGGS